MKSHTTIINHQYIPFLKPISDLDNIIISYFSSENLIYTIASIKPDKTRYTYLSELNAKFRKALEESYDLINKPIDLEKTKMRLLEFSEIDECKDSLSPTIEKEIQEEALSYVTYYPADAKNFLIEIFNKNSSTAQRLINYLLDAGVNLNGIVLDEKIIQKYSANELEFFINHGAAYSITYDHTLYLTPLSFICGINCNSIPPLWSSMLIATFHDDNKTHVFSSHYPQHINLTARTLDQFYLHLKKGTLMHNEDGCYCCGNSQSCLMGTITCGIYINNFYQGEKIPCNSMTHENYKLLDVAYAKYRLMSSVDDDLWKYNKYDKEQIKLIIDNKFSEAKTLEDYKQLYNELIRDGWLNQTHKADRPITRLLHNSSYSSLKVYTIQKLKNKVLSIITNKISAAKGIEYCYQLYNELTQNEWLNQTFESNRFITKLFHHSFYSSLKISTIQQLQNKALAVLEDKKDFYLPKELLSFYQEALESPLFDPVHESKGVSSKSRKTLINKMSHLKDYMESGYKLMLKV